MNVLVVAAHPDDEALGCGGTIHKLSRDGATVTVCLASHASPTRECGLTDKVSVSHEILGVAKAIIGDFECMRFKDACHHDIVSFIETAIRDSQPDLVFMHHPNDVHQDHQILSECTLEAIRLPQRQIEEIHAIKGAYFMEVPSSTDWNATGKRFEPNAYVEINEADIAAKLSAISVYEDVIRSEPHPRSRRGIEALSVVRGALFGVRGAEAFQQVFGAVL